MACSSLFVGPRSVCAPRACARRASRAVARPAPASRARTVGVKAELQDPRQNVERAFERFLQRYDVLSTGFGAMLVTSWCVAKGQDPFTAMGITVTATVVALVANELLFTNNDNTSK